MTSEQFLESKNAHIKMCIPLEALRIQYLRPISPVVTVLGLGYKGALLNNAPEMQHVRTLINQTASLSCRRNNFLAKIPLVRSILEVLFHLFRTRMWPIQGAVN